MKKKVINLFSNKNHTTAPAPLVEVGKELAIPSQELRRELRPSAADHRHARETARLALEQSLAKESRVESIASGTCSPKSDRTVKTRTPPKREISPPKPFYSTLETSAVVVMLVVLFNLSCEVRIKGALLSPGGLRVLLNEVMNGVSIFEIAARELASLVVSLLLVVSWLTAVICSLDSNS